jgi:hypothetical protein
MIHDDRHTSAVDLARFFNFIPGLRSRIARNGVSVRTHANRLGFPVASPSPGTSATAMAVSEHVDVEEEVDEVAMAESLNSVLADALASPAVSDEAKQTLRQTLLVTKEQLEDRGEHEAAGRIRLDG